MSARSLPSRVVRRLTALAPSTLGEGPPAVDGTSDPSGPQVVQIAVAGCSAIVHGSMYAITGQDTFLWVAALSTVYLFVGVPLVIRMAKKHSPSLATWLDLLTMIVLATILGDPITLLAWFPLLLVANLIYEGTVDAVRNVMGMVAVTALYVVVTVQLPDRLFGAEVARTYVALTLFMWLSASIVYALAIGKAVTKREDEVADAIAQRDAAEARARTDAGRFRAFLEEAPIGLLVQDFDETFEYANAPALEMLGLTLDELRTHGAAPAMPPGTREAVENEIRTARDRSKPFQIEHETVAGRIIELRGRHVELDGRFTTLTTLRDLTPERLADGHIARLRILVESSETYMVVWDEDGRIVIANRVFRETWADGEPVAGRSIIEVAGEQVRPFVEMGRLHSERMYERVVRVPDGRDLLISMSVADFPDPLDGRWLRAVTARDLSEVAHARRQLEELVASKDQFIASVSHELRTPLTVVVGLAAELAAHPERHDPEELAEFATLIAGQANEVAALVEDLLTMARADAGVLSIEPDSIDLQAMVGEVLAGLPGDLRSRVTWRAGSSPAVLADAVRVRQIVRNLVTNAGRHGGPGIEVEVMPGRVQVRDDGPPVPESERERMFQAYERVHHQRGKPDSVGLGLTVCRRLSRLMAGDVTYGHDGRQSIFELTLPVV